MTDTEQSKIVKSMRNAIKNGNLDLVKELLMDNEGLLEVNTVFGSWLHIAASYGRTDIASYLIDCGIDVNRNGDISGGNPIRSAAENGQIDMVELLYNSGTVFDVSEATKNPLFGAIYGGHYNVVRFLVEHGIDIAKYYSIGESEKADACEYAKQLGQTEIEGYLRACGNVDKAHKNDIVM
ncbi:MAG: ankyrin repeat domain-containing protein [Butyrivibrio sp.]|nr:ankyrin repeat domain-containing protein [Butyrivibrio sp.]